MPTPTPTPRSLKPDASPSSRPSRSRAGALARWRVPSLLTALVLLTGARDAQAVNTQMPVTDWTIPGSGYSKIELVTYINPLPVARTGQVGPSHFYGNQFDSQYGEGGYIGLQFFPNEQRAIFSWWNALDVYCGHSTNIIACGNFSGEGTGKQVVVRMQLQPGHHYLQHLHAAWSDAVGTWWDAWVIDQDTGVRTNIGSIKTPNSWGRLQGWMNQWIEYLAWGSVSTCSQIPYADGWRSAPTFDGVRAPNHVNRLAYTGCAASVWDHNGGVVHAVGTR